MNKKKEMLKFHIKAAIIQRFYKKNKMRKRIMQ